MKQLLQHYGYSNQDVAYYMENHTEGRGGILSSLSGFEVLSTRDNEQLLIEEGIINE